MWNLIFTNWYFSYQVQINRGLVVQLMGHSQTTLTRFYPLLTTKYPLLIFGTVLLYCYWIPFKIPMYLLCLLNVICECPSPQPFRLWRKKSKVKYRYGSKMAGIFSADSKCIKLVEHSPKPSRKIEPVNKTFLFWYWQRLFF